MPAFPSEENNPDNIEVDLLPLLPIVLNVEPTLEPCEANLAKALVISIILLLTAGAFDRVSINSARFFANNGRFVIALPASLEIADAISFIPDILNFNSPIWFICRTKLCNCADNVGRFFVACVDALPPSLDNVGISCASPVTSNVMAPILFIPATKLAKSSLILIRFPVPVVAFFPPSFDNAAAMLVTPATLIFCAPAKPLDRFCNAEVTPYIEFVSTSENLLNALARDVISADFPPLKPVAESDSVLIPDAILVSF